MRELTKNIPQIKKIPWMAMIFHITNKSKNGSYSKNFGNFKNKIEVRDFFLDLYNIVDRMIKSNPDISLGWVGPICIIDVRNPEYLKIVLNSEKCIDRAVFYSFPYKTGLLFSGGDLWRRHRKILNPAFSTNKLNKFLPIINEKARKLIDVLDFFVTRDAFNVVRLLSALTLESLLKTSFRLEMDFINNPYDQFFDIVKK